jgi:peptide/nickel transport system ATP-binding protein/energy-coupling factor transport system ATP-binding protein
MEGSAVQLRDVFCVHRTPEGDAAALQGLSLELRHGERLCVLGPSGAGKTTLLRVIAGMQPPSAGSVLVFGRDPGRLSGRERAALRHHWIGFLDQHAEATLPPDLTVGRAVELPLALRGVPRAARRARATELLEVAGLGDRAGALPSQLSGGERQRVALCAALAHRPLLLLADEPTAELDEASAESVAGLIEELAAAHGTTVIVVSHDPALADRAERTVRIRDGRVVEQRERGRGSLTVAGDGWVQLPAGMLERAGIDGAVHAVAVDGGVLLQPIRPAAPPPPVEIDVRVADAAAVPASVELRQVTRERGRGSDRRTVLDRLTLTFEPGQLTVVTGRSGAGKSTLLELLAGLVTPDAGELWLDGRPLEHLDREQLAAVRRERIGYLPQEPVPVGFLSAAENVALSLRVRGQPPGAASARAHAVLRTLGLGGRALQRVERLSAGEAQRVALARAIACARGLLVVDEPTSRLDERNAAAVARVLSETAADGHTVICATHDEELIAHAERVVELGLPHFPAAGDPVGEPISTWRRS